MRPEAGRRPASARSSVDLPAPFGPRRSERLAGGEREAQAMEDEAAAAGAGEVGDGQAHAPRIADRRGAWEGARRDGTVGYAIEFERLFLGGEAVARLLTCAGAASQITLVRRRRLGSDASE